MKYHERDKRCQKWKPADFYEITEPEQMRPKNFQDVLHDDHFKKLTRQIYN